MRDFYVGEMSRVHSSMATMMPRLVDKLNERSIDTAQNSGEPARADRADGLYESNSNLRERGASYRFVIETSPYQKVQIHPVLTGMLAAGAGVAIAAVVRNLRKPNGIEEKLEEAKRTQLPNPEWDIHEHMEVVSSDGENIGTIETIDGTRLKLTRTDAPDGMHHHILTELIHRVEGDKVLLRKPAEQVRREWI